MITVHHLENSRSHRIIWLLEELGLDYDIVKYAREPGGRAPLALREIHPLGKAPVIVEDGIVLAESGAIIEHILAVHGAGRFAPSPGTAEHRRYRQLMHYAEGSAMPNMLLKVVFDQIEAGPVPFFIRPVVRGLARAVKASVVDPQLALHLDVLESELAGHLWFTGPDFTAADIQMSFPVEGAAARDLIDATRPNLAGWLDRIHARPAWGRAIARGGAHDLR